MTSETATPLPTIFVGCAIEDLPTAEAVQELLDYDAQVELWHETFLPSGSAVPDLISTTRRVDFALFIATAVDTLSTRQETFNVARDNVIFELGLFLSALGVERTFLMIPRVAVPTLPTDLIGFNTLNWDPRKDSLKTAVGPACTKLKTAIGNKGRRHANEA